MSFLPTSPSTRRMTTWMWRPVVSFVPYGHPLERAAANINGDDSLLQRFNDRLLSTFPSACACPSEEPCEALGTQDELRAALSEFVV